MVYLSETAGRECFGRHMLAGYIQYIIVCREMQEKKREIWERIYFLFIDKAAFLCYTVLAKQIE